MEQKRERRGKLTPEEIESVRNTLGQPFGSLAKAAALVGYSDKTSLNKALRNAGFRVVKTLERIQGKDN